MNLYVTFDESHQHIIQGFEFNQNTVAVIPCVNELDGRNQSYDLFGDSFAHKYYGSEFKELQYAGKTFLDIEVSVYPRITGSAPRSAGLHDDMNTGSLRLFQDDDGDISVSITDNDGLMVDLEFCTSGGSCPNTMVALRNLMKAIKKDCANLPDNRLVRQV